MKFLDKLLRKHRSKKRIVMPGNHASGMYASTGWVKKDKDGSVKKSDG